MRIFYLEKTNIKHYVKLDKNQKPRITTNLEEATLFTEKEAKIMKHNLENSAYVSSALFKIKNKILTPPTTTETTKKTFEITISLEVEIEAKNGIDHKKVLIEELGRGSDRVVLQNYRLTSKQSIPYQLCMFAAKYGKIKEKGE